MKNNNLRFNSFGHFADPFTIGLNLLGGENPIQPDDKAADYLALKQLLLAADETDVFRMEPDTVAAQREVLELVLKCLGKPLKTSSSKITCPTLDIQYTHEDYANRPLLLASLLVQEDLVLMRRVEDSWTFVAASVCFPSSWSLTEKFGKPLAKIHQPVPGANRNFDQMIQRIFDNLKPELPVWRENWSFYGDNNLRHSTHEDERIPGGKTEKTAHNTWLRREFQTLTRLPVSMDILFTIKILIEPLVIIEKQDNPGKIAATLLKQIDAMTAEQRRYKGFGGDWRDVEKYLRSMAGNIQHC